MGYHPILASRAETGEVLHLRLRKGSANTQRGILRFTDELIARVNRAGASGAKLYADSGFWNAKVLARLERAGWTYSIGIRMAKHVRAVIEQIPETAWTTIADYPDSGEAQIAETVLGDRQADRPAHPPARRPSRAVSRLAPLPVLTNRTDCIAVVEAEHRQHAVVELVIRDPKTKHSPTSLRSVSRQRRLDGDRRARAQPAALDRTTRSARADHPRRPNRPAAAARATRPPDDTRRLLDAVPAARWPGVSG